MKIDLERVNYETAPQVKQSVLAAIEAGDGVIDLSTVRHADSTMLSILLSAVRRSQKKGAALRIVGMPAELEALAELYSVGRFLPAARQDAPAGDIRPS